MPSIPQPVPATKHPASVSSTIETVLIAQIGPLNCGERYHIKLGKKYGKLTRL